MKEFTEKLISRLEEESYDMEICEEQFDMNRPYFKDVPYKMLKLEDVKTIISQFAEEYLPDTNVGNKNGWVPCSEKLPTRYCHCLVTRRNEYEDGFDTGVREDTYVEIEGIWDWQSKHEGLIDEIIAWMPLPAPYKEKGE